MEPPRNERVSFTTARDNFRPAPVHRVCHDLLYTSVETDSTVQLVKNQA
jgi:hypothetical protein